MAEFKWKPLDNEDVDMHTDPEANVTAHLGIKKTLVMEQPSEAEMETSGELYDAVEEIISKVRPFVQKDGGDVFLKGIKNGWVHIKFEGNCTSCSISSGTVLEIEECICEELPKVKGVEVIQD